MNTAGSSQRSPSLPASSAGSGHTTDALGFEQGADPDERTVISQRPPHPSPGSGRPATSFELGKLLAGERLNHFELLEYVGGGGMGAVFRALDTMLNREVALKVLSRDQGADEETRRRFQNEAQSAARLDHDNIARVFYVGEDKGLNYIVFEFIEGVNLREFVEKKGPLPLPEAISYTLQIADALAHASSRDVVHRDIKPSNVIITEDGRAKLVDMGLARLHQVQADGEELTASGVTLGTFDYISPEQARDPRSADVRSDIYSLGCTLYFMLTGRPPFPEGTVLQKLLQHNSDAPPDPRELNPDLPLELSEVVRRMLAKDPRRRFQHPSELITELYLLAEQIGCPAPTTIRPTWLAPAPPQRMSAFERHLPWIIPIAALLAIVAFLDRWPGSPSDSGTEVPIDQSGELANPPDSVAAVPPNQRKSARAVANNRQAKSESDARQPLPSDVPDSIASPGPPTAPDASAAEDDAQETPAEDGAKTTADVASRDLGEMKRGRSAEERPAGEGASLGGVRSSVATGSESDLKGSVGAKAATASEALPVAAATNDSPGERSPREPPTKPAIPADEPPPPGVLVVCDEPVGPQRFATLRAACMAARSNDIIELQYNGLRAEEPISLENLRLVIRSKEGFQPVISFQPPDADPYKFPHSMLKVMRGTLKLVNVAIELDMPRGLPSEDWALFELQLVESLTLEKCLLTVKNASDQYGAYHNKVSFIQLKGAPGADAMMPKGMMALSPTEIRLDDCAARGEADFLRDDEAQPVRLTWKNGLLCTSEWLLTAGGATTIPSQAGGGPAKMRLELSHLTVAVGQGLCRMRNSYSSPGLLDADIRCTDSILLNGSGVGALIEQVGVDPLYEWQRRIAWEGEHNIYNGFSTFWRIGDAALGSVAQSEGFEEWKRHWSSEEVRPSEAPITWKRLPPVQLPCHDRSTADYAIDEGENAPVYVTTDDTMVGVDASLLPAWLWQSDPNLEHATTEDPPEFD